jgi:hypothetical protein
MIISQCEFSELLTKLDNISQTSGWEIANVIATFCAVIVALFFPLREYIRTLFPKFVLKTNIPEIRETNLDGINKPHIGMLIKNLSKEVLYLKDAYLYFDLKDYHDFRVHLHLGLNSEVKILPYSEEFVEYFIWHKDVDNGRKPVKEFLSTDKQVAKQYLEGITGYEKVKKIFLCVHTNLGRSCRKIPKWGWEELTEQLLDIAYSLDKEQQAIIKKYTSKKADQNIKENFSEYLSKMNELDKKRHQEYKDKCIKGKKEEKERKMRRKEILKKNRVNILKGIFTHD